ncbi:ubiquitin-protein ligase (E3) [Coemansia sp. RSA 988]|nr:ubiquitin-protein ligase (E3) [Coemansia sp. RSA 988]
MFSFRGEFKRQKDINLGGRRRNDTAHSNAQSVLVKAHEEREKRELERLKRIAALKIQRLWRGWRDTTRWRLQMREQLDMSVFENPTSSLERSYISLRDFTVYYNGSPDDIKRLHIILRALFMPRTGNTTTSDLCYSHILAAEDTQMDDTEGSRRHMWPVLISRLFGSALKVPKDGVLRVDVGLVLGALANAVALDKTNASEMWPLMTNMIELHELYPFLSRCLYQEPALDSSATENVVRLAMMPISSGPLQRIAISCFVRWILALPGLLNRIGVQGATVIAKADVNWCAIVEGVSHEMARQQQKQQGQNKSIQFRIFEDAKTKAIALPLAAINIIGNMTAFVLPRLSHGESLEHLDVGYIEACFACAQVIPSCDLLNSKQIIVSDGTAAQIAKAVDVHARKWLKGVLSTQVVGLLVRVGCINSKSEYGAYADTAQKLLLTFIQKWGKTASSMAIDNVFQIVDIRTIGWRAILQDRQFLEQFGGDQVGVDTIKSHDLTKLHLLCEVFNRQLQTIGDDELFERGMSLPLDEIKAIARVSRNIAFALYWTQASSDELVHIRDSAAALTRRLFIRNSRHQFVNKGFWHVPSSLLDMSSFVDRVAEDPMFLVKDEGIDSDDTSSEESESDSESNSDAGEGIDISRAGIRAPDRGLDWMVDTYSRISRQHQSHTDHRILTPRIAVLRNIPFVVPFNDRVGLFHTLINRDRSRLGLSSIGDIASPMAPSMFRAENVVIRRGNVFEDGFRSIFPVLSGKPVVELDDDAGTDEQPRQQSSNHMSRLRTGAGGSLAMRGFDTSENGDNMLDDDDEEMLQPTGGTSSWMDEMDAMFSGRRNPNQDFAFQNAVGGLTGSQPSQQDMFKYRMRITFVDQHGTIEEGIDGGGLFKEFLVSLVHEAFDPSKELFCQTKQNSIYPNPTSMPTDPKRRRLILDKYKFLGAIIGKALYEGVLVDVPFALFFLGYCVGRHPEFNDLPTFDHDLYKNLVLLKNHPIPTRSDTNAGVDNNDDDDEIFRLYHMHFSVTSSLPDGKTKEYPLVPNGEDVKVTSRNRHMYLDLLAEYKLSKQIRAQVEAFMEGLRMVIPENWLRLLFASPLEFSQLLCGDSSAIDIADWQQNTVYNGEFRNEGHSHRVVQDFWHVVSEDLTEEERRKLCGFATSCERPPLLGFRELNPRFCISGYSHDPEGGVNIDDRLPSASTCVNLLKLPVYSSRQILHRKLVDAITSKTGFGFS